MASQKSSETDDNDEVINIKKRWFKLRHLVLKYTLSYKNDSNIDIGTTTTWYWFTFYYR